MKPSITSESYRQPRPTSHSSLLRAWRHSLAALAHPGWINKISDMHLFDKGWEKLREQIFANQQRLGVIPQGTQLTPWPKDILPKWDTLPDENKKLFVHQADVFGAYVAYTDHEIGRVIQAVEDMGRLDDASAAMAFTC
jgi:arylsulfatase A-like enzyme